ncbi:MAG: Smr/MutS family protein [Pseudomonadota bacterium]
MAVKSYRVGDEVRVKSLGKDGIIVEITTKGTYRVAVGSMNLEVNEKDLIDSPPDKWKKATEKLKSKKLPVEGQITHEIMPEILDLHGLRVEEALPKVSHFLDQAILQDKDFARILHGLGTGKLLEAVHKLLKSTPTVKHFELEQGNPGITRVYF